MHVRRIALAIVDDPHGDAFVRSSSPSIQTVAAGKVDRVLHQVAQAVDDLGPAQDQWAGGPSPSMAGRKVELHAPCPAPYAARPPRAAAAPRGACRRCRSSLPARPMTRRMSRQRSACSRISRASSSSSGWSSSSSHQLGADQLDRGQRRAQLMRRRRHHAAQVGQLLFARQRHLRRQQRIATSPASRSRPGANTAPGTGCRSRSTARSRTRTSAAPPARRRRQSAAAMFQNADDRDQHDRQPPPEAASTAAPARWPRW